MPFLCPRGRFFVPLCFEPVCDRLFSVTITSRVETVGGAVTSEKATYEDLFIAVEFGHARDFGWLFNHELSHGGTAASRTTSFC